MLLKINNDEKNLNEVFDFFREAQKYEKNISEKIK